LQEEQNKNCKNCQKLLIRKQSKFCSDYCSCRYWYHNHKSRAAFFQRQAYQNIKSKIFNLLGNKCANPYNIRHGNFLEDKRCFQIDHIHGGGTRQIRLEARKHGKYGYLRKILTDLENSSKEYQLLCANCNQIKRIEEKEDYLRMKNPRKDKKKDD
jgi:hypothetical protein